MTYSIVARDAATGEIGVAVQTALIGVGVLCPWAEAGVGAVATQSLVRVSHGPSGLSLMRNGHTAPEALAAVLAGDEGREQRQIGMIDADGNVESYTGAQCIRYAGHKVGESYAVQANMMRHDTVPEAMSVAYEATEGPLLLRLVAALQAAQAEGGDFRGQQSAALLVVSGDLPKNAWSGVLYDIRVDDHPTPVDELARLCNKRMAWERMDDAYGAMADGDFDKVMAIYDEVVAADPDSQQMQFGFALTVATRYDNLARVEPILRRLFGSEDGEMWVEYVKRYQEAGYMPDETKVKQILALAK